MMKARVFAAMVIVLGACGNKDPFLYYSKPEKGSVTFDTNVKEMIGANRVDLLWVIDNSGSMGPHQGNVIDNSALFMQDFIKNGLQWKLGLISTSYNADPYYGFSQNQSLDYRTVDPVKVFQDSVRALGVSGDATERTFSPIVKALRSNPGFLRADTPLAVIVVTDAEEQSDESSYYGGWFAPSMAYAAFLQEFRTLIGARPYYVYGIYNANDLGCTDRFDDLPWSYAGSPYELFHQGANASGAFALCTPNFGKTLARIGQDIVQRVVRSEIRLKHRPKERTIQVLHKGALIRGGKREEGGYWMYDYGKNAIVFSDLSFADGDTESVSIQYSPDDGLE